MEELVSICIVSYNAEDTIIETLESILQQDYKRLELIVSDDCSKDTTVSVATKWMNDNSSRFERCKVLSGIENVGTVLNLRRCINEATGEWIKVFSADDLLIPTAISSYMENVKLNQSYDFFCCDLQPFSYGRTVTPQIEKALKDFFLSVSETYEQKLRKNDYSYTIMGPGFFFTKKLYDLVDGYDPRFPMYEEWPFVYKIINAGYDIRPVNLKLVKYRVSNTSLSGNTKSPAAKRLLQSKKDFFNQVRKPALLKKHMYLRVWKEMIRFRVQTIQTYSNNRFVCFAANFLYLFSPRHYIDFFRS